MSTASYQRNPNIVRKVIYALSVGRERENRYEYVCYEKTDEDAIKSAYKNLVWSGHPSFRIVDIVTEEG
jgi:hypothetical protein